MSTWSAYWQTCSRADIWYSSPIILHIKSLFLTFLPDIHHHIVYILQAYSWVAHRVFTIKLSAYYRLILDLLTRYSPPHCLHIISLFLSCSSGIHHQIVCILQAYSWVAYQVFTVHHQTQSQKQRLIIRDLCFIIKANKNHWSKPMYEGLNIMSKSKYSPIVWHPAVYNFSSKSSSRNS